MGSTSGPARGVVCIDSAAPAAPVDSHEFAPTVDDYVRRCGRGGSLILWVRAVAGGSCVFWAATAEEVDDAEDADDRVVARGVGLVGRLDLADVLEAVARASPFAAMSATPGRLQTHMMCLVAAEAYGALSRAGRASANYQHTPYPGMDDGFFADPGFCVELVAASGSSRVLSDPRVDRCAELLEDLPRGVPVLARFLPQVLREALPRLLLEIVGACGSELAHVPEDLRTPEMRAAALARGGAPPPPTRRAPAGG